MENTKELLRIDPETKTAEQLKELELKAKQQQEARAEEERQRKEDRRIQDERQSAIWKPVYAAFEKTQDEYKAITERAKEIGLQAALQEANQLLAENREAENREAEKREAETK